ncbi:Ficolin-2, partial [Lamellibrachia satsuma]
LANKCRVVAFFTVLWAAVFCQNTCKPKDCVDLKCFRVSTAKDGPHTIYPGIPSLASTKVSCDQITSGGGWIVYQRRVNGRVNFTRLWEDYKNGFGEQGGPDTELWLGNEIVYQLTNKYTCQLHVGAVAYDNTFCSMQAENFRLEKESEYYKLQYGNTGSLINMKARDMNYQRNKKFLTKDHTGNSGRCTKVYSGGWWFGQCVIIFLNGKYEPNNTNSYNSIYVDSFKGSQALRGSHMLFRASDSGSRACNNPCLNNGVCEYVAASSSHRCVCPKTHCGVKCEKPNTCENNGLCLYDATKQTTLCKCAAGFTGPLCGTKITTTMTRKITTTTTTTTTTTREMTEKPPTPAALRSSPIFVIACVIALLVVATALTMCFIVEKQKKRNEEKKEEERQRLLEEEERAAEEETHFWSVFGL